MRHSVKICTFLCFSLTVFGCNKTNQTGDKDKGQYGSKRPEKSEEKEEAEKDIVAGIKVEKFAYAPEHWNDLLAFDSRTGDLRPIFQNTSDATFMDKLPTIKAGIKSIGKENINAITNDDEFSILHIAADRFFPKFKSYSGLSAVKKLNEEITIPLLKKGLNPDLENKYKETVKDVIASLSGFTEEQKNYLLEPIVYYEPSESVRDALDAIVISLNNIKNYDKEGKEVLNNLKKLTPYFVAIGSQKLASEIVNQFSKALLDDKKVLSSDINNEVKNYIDGLRKGSQPITDIGNLSLQGALEVLRTLAIL